MTRISNLSQSPPAATRSRGFADASHGGFSDFGPEGRCEQLLDQSKLDINMIARSNRWLWLLVLSCVAFLAPAGQAVCTYTLSTTSRTHGYGTASNAVVLTTTSPCSWTVINTNTWIAFATPSSGSGSFTNIYFVDANPYPVWRTGVVLIANQKFTVRQNPISCAYSLSPATRTHGYSLATGTLSVATSAGCPWFVTNANNWINILSGSSGTGNNTVTYTVNDNPGASWRTGVVF